MADFTFLDHTGDIGFDLRAGSQEELFQAAARGLYEIMVERVPAVGETEAKVEVEEESPDLLLRSFLSDLLYRFLAHREILVRFQEFRIEGRRLTARASAARFEAQRDGLRTELKAVTYHQLDVHRDDSGWFARVIYDV